MAATTTSTSKTDGEPRPIRVTTGGHVVKYAERAIALLEAGSPAILTTQLSTEPKANSTLHPATLAIPRLISVVEKVKREWLKTHNEVWQYNVSGHMKSQERPSLERVLSGKTKPKMTHNPYLEITLSGSELDLEGATVQHERRKKEKRKSDVARDDVQAKRARLG
ncbi:hypothetical protein A1Q1_05720 [Trichosporon asahii var. asahii CBS 2479]|uniref:DNA/RNA-binding protein Alba-like domain-containing protein n=1 Tax=Trichosporon asahii var. asahii (strain ATCC 90039 / CBS 2479 / JCM 2466 / KCTC 7840 / NBRC 103889/ NCYC 2677 / UAMH 7654) TaxID=1186058 RepID=J6EST0_TRIAS|nr:hypothetical protein A1Q1_05720 [Trichosporon asahii var. asahii CBS 2479]EJT45807.1 hypothetical protein A1Q1_05720 [Trichosporon asahii var. asahii CBS 2479]